MSYTPTRKLPLGNTDRQQYWIDKLEVDDIDAELVTKTLINLLGYIKTWELKIDDIINNPDDQEALADVQEVSNQMMLVNN